MDVADVVIDEEPLTRELMVEIVPLLQAHKASLPGYLEEPININWKIYQILADGGLLRIYTVRESEVLVGYAVYTINPNMRHQHLLQAQQDVLYIRKESRKGSLGLLLLKFAERKLTELGVNLIIHTVNESYDFSALLMFLDYEPLERTYIKKVNQ